MASTKTSRQTRQIQNGAQIRIRNDTPTVMNFNKDITWFGTLSAPGFPDVIDPAYDPFFVHLGDADDSSVALFYYGKKVNRAWVLAWDVPTNDTIPTSNKVYVVCGTKTVIGAMTNDEICTNLSKASTTTDATDENSKTRARASIAYSPQNQAALVTATFGLIKPI